MIVLCLLDDAYLVASFDFAQNVSYPSSPLQPGSAYFKAARKCAVFGIHNEQTHVQVNLCIDEAEMIGKGPNCVVSLLHHYLQTVTCETLVFFADNCVAQNKNNTVLQYFQWRVLCGLNTEIFHNFLLTGHTKFSPDRMFGLAKRKYSQCDVDTHDDFLACMEKSSTYNIAVSGKEIVWYEWDKFLRSYFKSLPQITSYHHFLIDVTGIQCKAFAQSSTSTHHNLVLRPLDCNILPPVITPVGLTPQRQQYLYQQVRSLCMDKTKQDIVAPKPTGT